MLVWWCCYVALLGADPTQADLLNGETVSGELLRITPEAVVFKEKNLPLAEVLELRTASIPSTAGSSANELMLNDGSRLSATDVVHTDAGWEIKGPGFGTAKLPANAVRYARLAPVDAKVQLEWLKLTEKETKKDLLVIRKGDKLDFVQGVVGDIDATSVKFLLGEDLVPVKRERLYGIVFAPLRQPVVAAKIGLTLVSGDRLQARTLTLNESAAQLTLAGGGELSIPRDQLRIVDFSAGKVRQLANWEPRDLQYVPYFDIVWKYRANRGPEGGPLRLGNKTYGRGLCLHSRTTMKWRLEGEYRRLQGIIGIDEASDPTGQLGDVQLKILGDGRELLSTSVKGTDDPRPLDLDVNGVRDLEILVDFGEELDIADWLSLAEVRVIK